MIGASQVVIKTDTDCMICGLGGAFASPKAFDTCARCGWIDDPSAYEKPDEPSDMNDVSLLGARQSWPKRSIDQLQSAPISSLDIVMREDSDQGFDFLIDGRSVCAIFPQASLLKAAIGPWDGFFGTSTPLVTGIPNETQRFPVYVCPLCGDSDEGAITTEVHMRGDRVIWSRIGWEIRDFVTDERELDVRARPLGFAFDRLAYERTFGDAQRAVKPGVLKRLKKWTYVQRIRKLLTRTQYEAAKASLKP